MTEKPPLWNGWPDEPQDAHERELASHRRKTIYATIAFVVLCGIIGLLAGYGALWQIEEPPKVEVLR